MKEEDMVGEKIREIFSFLFPYYYLSLIVALN